MWVKCWSQQHEEWWNSSLWSMDLVSLALINSGELDCPIIDWQKAVSANLVQLTVLAVFYSPLFNLLCLSINCSKKWFAGRSCQHQSVWWNLCYLCQSWKLKSTITAVVMRHMGVTETATADISSFFFFYAASCWSAAGELITVVQSHCKVDDMLLLMQQPQEC